MVNMHGNKINRVYCDLLQKLLAVGDEVKTRNSDVRRLHTYTYIFDQTPLVTIRRTAWRSALSEMEWFLSGSNNINDLPQEVRKWWSPWADKQGVVRYNYGEQFRNWATHKDTPAGGVAPFTFDQLQAFLYGVRKHPHSRRNIMTTWNAADMYAGDCPITNCHGTVIQAFYRPSGFLDLTMYQRSVDVICGLPHNWIQYWGFMQWVARVTGHKPGAFYWIGGDIHLYREHFDLARKLLRLAEESPNSLYHNVPDLIHSPDPKYYTGKEWKCEFKAADFSLTHKYMAHCNDIALMVV